MIAFPFRYQCDSIQTALPPPKTFIVIIVCSSHQYIMQTALHVYHSVLSLISRVTEEDRGAWDWESGLSYECRTLLFKALHNLIER